METVIGNTIKDQLSSGATDGSGQPWYWRWGVAALGVVGGLLLFFSGLSSILDFSLVNIILKMGFASVLICFEATALAQGFNWAFCQALVGIAEKVPALARSTVYAGLSIVLIIVKFSNIIICLLPMCCAAAYFMLWLDTRNQSQPAEFQDETPVVDNEFA